jgi:hypothetical protein
MATYFGTELTSGTEDSDNAGASMANNSAVLAYTCPGNVGEKYDINELSVYAKGTGNVRAAIYTTALALLTQWSAEVAVGAAFAWVAQTGFSATIQLDGATDYVLVFSQDNNSVITIRNTTEGVYSSKLQGVDYTGGFPDPIALPNIYQYKWSCRCGVTLAAGGGASIPVMMVNQRFRRI